MRGGVADIAHFVGSYGHDKGGKCAVGVDKNRICEGFKFVGKAPRGVLLDKFDKYRVEPG
jgi:hypothetical protein